MKKVLVADDEVSMRKLYERELKKVGYEVLLAANAHEAVQKAREERPDVVVLDIRMPGMDGIEAMGRILEENNTVPVIINTAYSTYQDSYLSWPAHAYLTKSSDVTELKETIQRVLEVVTEPALR